MNKVSLAVMALTVLASGSALALENRTVTTTTRYYYANDVNNNGVLDSQEFPTYVYRRWDKNGDGFLTSDEWELNTVRWYAPGTTTYKTYTTWDKDGNGRLDQDEFGTVVSETKLYDAWDMNEDNTLAGEEYAEATFRIYDTNDDGELSMEEWKNAQ